MNKIYQVTAFIVFFVSFFFSSQIAFTFEQVRKTDSFAQGNRFKWDGSQPLGFPSYQGDLPFAKSAKTWDPNAKTFAAKSMDFIPPAVRPAIADKFVKQCDDVAGRNGKSVITSDIVAEALAELAKGAGMPENVIKNLPKTEADCSRARTPVPSDDLKKQYRQ